MKAENIGIQTFKEDSAKKHKAPPGLKVVPTPNVYTTDKVWNELAPDYSKGLPNLPVIKDCPELWTVLTLDGYGSHLQGDAFDNISRLQDFDCEI